MENKEKSCLITQNLIGSINWFITAPESIIRPEKGGDGKRTWAQKAKKDLLNLLNREKGEFTEAARQGVEFEKMIYKYANESEIPKKFSNKFKTICKEVKGFEFFQKGGKVLNIKENQCYLYAKYDAIKSNFIKDIKTTAKYSFGKYLKGVQHKLYCYIKNAERFEYIIAEWEKYPKIKQIHKEVFIVKDFEALEKELITIIENALNFLKEVNLWNIYREKYCLY